MRLDRRRGIGRWSAERNHDQGGEEDPRHLTKDFVEGEGQALTPDDAAKLALSSQ